MDKHSILLGLFVSYKKVLWKWPQDFWIWLLVVKGTFLYELIIINIVNTKPGKPCWRGRNTTVDLPVPTSLDQLYLILNILLPSLQNKLHWWGGQLYWAFPSVSIPWLNFNSFWCEEKFHYGTNTTLGFQGSKMVAKLDKFASIGSNNSNVYKYLDYNFRQALMVIGYLSDFWYLT